MQKIAFVAYETPFAPAGGVAAVMRKLPPEVARLNLGDVLVFTPFHHQIKSTSDLAGELDSVAQFDVTFRGEPVGVSVDQGSAGFRFIRTNDERIFAGQPHPYLVNEDDLRRDALLFGVATWRALQLIDADAEWVLLLQDWEAATTALAAASDGASPRMVLTLHNSYDTGITDTQLREFGLDPATCQGTTALTRALPLVSRQVPTVSGQFAADLMTDVLQSEVIADHLGEALAKKRLIGINNGPFIDADVAADVIVEATRGHFERLLKWKKTQRVEALRALARFSPSAKKPLWANRDRVLRRAEGEIPWFVMAGRDDARQKGYDVAAEAIRLFIRQGGLGCFFFFPIPGDDGLEGVSFLEDLSTEFPDSVATFPFRWSEGFSKTLNGATFGLMPSFYEPFGMANEFYLRGAVGIGRATGGIVEQIIPLRGCASFSLAAEGVAANWHGTSARPTGILYRESRELADVLDGWRAINEPADNPRERLERRKRLPLFQSMVSELCIAMMDGCTLANQPDLYCQMLVDGIRHIRQGFSWERAAREYARIGGLG